MKATMKKKIEAAQATLIAAERHLDRLLSMPEEPNFDEINLVWFEKRFKPNGLSYTYAAVKADDGYWYVTGRNDTRWTWDELMAFVGPDTELWLVSQVTKMGDE